MDDSDDDYYSFFRRRRQPPSSATLIAFYDGSGTDGRGRTLAQILQWDAGRLESSHDYIQTLFPLPEKSGMNDFAPIINNEVFEAFRGRPELRERLRDAFKKILWFYGFELVEEEGKLTVRPGPNIEFHSEFWNSRFDHNHLRITRIIRCLRVLGLEKEALAFYDTMSCAGTVSSTSRLYWRRAAHRQLNIRPDISDSQADPEDPRLGPKFLVDFERQRKELEKALADSREEHDIKEALQASQTAERENKEVESTEPTAQDDKVSLEVVKEGQGSEDAGPPSIDGNGIQETDPESTLELEANSKLSEDTKSKGIPLNDLTENKLDPAMEKTSGTDGGEEVPALENITTQADKVSPKVSDIKQGVDISKDEEKTV